MLLLLKSSSYMGSMINNFITYSSAKLIKGIVPFLLLPFILKYLSLESFGLFSYIEVIVLMGAQFVLFGSHQIVAEKYDELKNKTLVRKISAYILMNTCIITIFYFFTLSHKLELTDIILVSVLTFLFAVNIFLTTALKIEGEAKTVFLGESLLACIRYIGGFLFIYFLWQSYGSLVATFLIGLIVTNLFFFFRQKKYLIGEELKAVEFKSLYQGGKYVLVYSICAYIIAMSDRLMIEQYIGLKDVGIYSVAYKIAGILQLFFLAYISTLMPKLYKTTKNDNINHNYINSKYIGLLVAAALVIIFSAYIYLNYFFNTNMESAFPIVVIVVSANIFHGINSLNYHILNILEKRRALAFCALLVAILNIGLNYFLLNEYGTIGAAWATLISYGVFTALMTLIRYIK